MYSIRILGERYVLSGVKCFNFRSGCWRYVFVRRCEKNLERRKEWRVTASRTKALLRASFYAHIWTLYSVFFLSCDHNISRHFELSYNYRPGKIRPVYETWYNAMFCIGKNPNFRPSTAWKLTPSPLWSPKILRWCGTFYNLTVQNFTCVASFRQILAVRRMQCVCISKLFNLKIIGKLKLC